MIAGRNRRVDQLDNREPGVPEMRTSQHSINHRVQGKHSVLCGVFFLMAWMCSAWAQELSIDDQLLSAAYSGDLAQVRKLVDAGADVNTETAVKGMSEDDLRQADLHGATPLFIAAHGGHVEIAELLIDAGANLNTKTGMETPLMVAAFLGHLQIVNFLIERGADVAISSGHGNAVNYGVHGGHLGVVSSLVNAGGYKPETLNGINALSTAKTNGHKEIDRLLQAELDHYIESGGLTESLLKAIAEEDWKVMQNVPGRD